jgi:acyl carrier protein
MTAAGTWEIFVSSIAEIAQVSPGEIRQESGLVDDLGLDSVALAEVVVLLVDDFDIAEVSTGVADGDWSTITVGELFRLHLGRGG